MSRPAVESTLFRARRRLTEEYDDLVSGARCRRIQAHHRGGRRDAGSARATTRRLARHVAHCQPCRREAMAAGLDSAILTRAPLRERAAEKVAALLPFGWFGRGRGGDAGTTSNWAAHVPMLSDQLQGGWGKLATAAAVLVVGAGAAGVGTKVVGSGDQPPSAGDRPAGIERTGAPAQGGGGAGGNAARTTLGTAGPQKAAKKSHKGDRAGKRRLGQRGTSGGDGGTLPVGLASGDGGGAAAGGSDAGGGAVKGLPKLELPGGGDNPVAPVQQTVEDVVEAVPPVVNDVTDTVEQTGGALEDTVEDVGGVADGVTDGILP